MAARCQSGNLEQAQVSSCACFGELAGSDANWRLEAPNENEENS